MLVYDPTNPSGSRDMAEKGKHLAEVEKELLRMARDVADVKSELIPVEAKWHSYVAGKDGTTLNAYVEKSILVLSTEVYNLGQYHRRRQDFVYQNRSRGWRRNCRLHSRSWCKLGCRPSCQRDQYHRREREERVNR